MDIKSRPTFADSNFKRVVHSPRNQPPFQFTGIWSLYQSFVSNACMRPRNFGESTRNGDQTDYHEGCKYEKGIRWQVRELRTNYFSPNLTRFKMDIATKLPRASDSQQRRSSAQIHSRAWAQSNCDWATVRSWRTAAWFCGSRMHYCVQWMENGTWRGVLSNAANYSFWAQRKWQSSKTYETGLWTPASDEQSFQGNKHRNEWGHQW